MVLTTILNLIKLRLKMFEMLETKVMSSNGLILFIKPHYIPKCFKKGCLWSDLKVNRF